jgi:ribonucleoside-diphosphate reductase alpha chain
MPYAPEGYALDVFKQRYAHHPDETWEQACARVARHVATAESASSSDALARVERFIDSHFDAFYQLLVENFFMPGGRIWYGAGRPKGQLLNCFVIPNGDSREAWGDTCKEMLIISGTGGGVGVPFSPVRPRGSAVHGTGGTATGAVSEMRMINGIGEEIKGGGGRRVALMFTLRANHGDILEFLHVKLDRKELNNANISVDFEDDPEAFFELVRSEAELDLTHNGRKVGSIPAKKLWDLLIKNSLESGEPGLLNGHYANKMNNLWYYKRLIATNPCGEIWLIAYDCCCLGSLVLPRFVKGTGMDWSLLATTVRTAVRFLDDVLTVNQYPMQQIAETCRDIRRIGLGVMGLHDMLLERGLAYTSAAGLEAVDKVMNFIKNEAYLASVDLAKEKGAFPAFNPELFLKSGFAKTLKPSIRQAIRAHGLRNCALLTVPPTGTTAIVCGVTSGIEPMYAPAYLRRWWVGDERREETVVHPLFQRYVSEGRDVSHFQGAYQLSLRDHLEMQRVVQRHIDNAVSKTINLVPGTSPEELSDALMEYFPELKGVTVYPEGSRENQPLTPIPADQAIAIAAQSIAGAAGNDSCRDGKCDI